MCPALSHLARYGFCDYQHRRVVHFAVTAYPVVGSVRGGPRAVPLCDCFVRILLSFILRVSNRFVIR